jgi:hypothetical protein
LKIHVQRAIMAISCGSSRLGELALVRRDDTVPDRVTKQRGSGGNE